MGPPKWPQTVYFERFGTLEHVLKFRRGGADARTDGRTHARTDAGWAHDPPPQRTQEKNTPFGSSPLTPIIVVKLIHLCWS